MIFRSPFELTRQECQFYRQTLQDIRDDRAERLGRLVPTMQVSLLDLQEISAFVSVLRRNVNNGKPLEALDQEDVLIESLSDLNSNFLPRMHHSYDIELSALRRPSRLMRAWPRLVAIPPITFLLFRLVYGSRETFEEQLFRVMDTLSGFCKSYLLQPVREILDTVRTGGEEGFRIVSQEGVKADMEARSHSFHISVLPNPFC